MRIFKIAILIAALVAAIFILYTNYQSSGDSGPVAKPQSATTSNVSDSSDSVSITVEPETSEPLVSGSGITNTQNTDDSSAVNDAGAESVQTPLPDYPELFGYEVGVTDISEEEFHSLVERLRNDPTLMSDLLNELRAETDVARLKRLTALLGETGSADVLPVTEELVYSANPATRKAGLDLLSRLAPNNAAAYDIANTILGSEADPKVLVSTMNVLAKPKNAGAEVKATAISQIMPLADHESPAVRRHSISMLVRLTDDESLAPILYNALSDSDASVREATVYAYASYPYQTAEVEQRLLEMVEDQSEQRGIRNGAALALSNMSPSEEIKARLKAAEKQMLSRVKVK